LKDVEGRYRGWLKAGGDRKPGQIEYYLVDLPELQVTGLLT